MKTTEEKIKRRDEYIADKVFWILLFLIGKTDKEDIELITAALKTCYSCGYKDCTDDIKEFMDKVEKKAIEKKAEETNAS